MNNTNNMNISNEHLLLINILNNMYNDNNRQIQNLNNQNNQIISIITDILHVPSSNNRQNNNNNNQNSNRRQNNREQGNRQNNRNNNNFGSVFLNNRQYTIDDIQRVDYPPVNVSVSGIEGRLCGNYRDAVIEEDTVRAAVRNAASRGAARDAAGNLADLYQGFFDPVVIYPTASQIETATRRVLYRDIAAPINSSCPISMDTFNDNETVTIIRHCGHIFNSDELATWFQSNCRCPVCRYDIRNFNRNISSLINQERSSAINDLIHDTSGNLFSPEDASGNSLQ
jgi:hypothetical protein